MQRTTNKEELLKRKWPLEKGTGGSEETVPKKKKRREEKKGGKGEEREGNTKVCLKRGCSLDGVLLVNESNAHCLLTRASETVSRRHDRRFLLIVAQIARECKLHAIKNSSRFEGVAYRGC